MKEEKQLIGVVGCGTMGIGIAQQAAASGHRVIVADISSEALAQAQSQLKRKLGRLAEKGIIDDRAVVAIEERISWHTDLRELAGCAMLLEAIVEDLAAKRSLFGQLEGICSDRCLLASNTSSLSITSIASGCKYPQRVLGLHFFNPVPRMALVEVVGGIMTDETVLAKARKLMEQWGKVPVQVKDTPGFIVNRVARPFYGEALRIYAEGIAGFSTIDSAMKTLGGFKMGPFELMDLVGNDINYQVTRTMWEQYHYEPRYKPSFTQKRMVEAGRLGRKAGIGFYDYGENAIRPKPADDPALLRQIFERIRVMLINEAADALFWGVASARDIDKAMQKGVNYPKGLLHWADELGIPSCVEMMDALYGLYKEDRYRCSAQLRMFASDGKTFF